MNRTAKYLVVYTVYTQNIEKKKRKETEREKKKNKVKLLTI